MAISDVSYARLIGAAVALLTLLALVSLMGSHLFHQRSDEQFLRTVESHQRALATLNRTAVTTPPGAHPLRT